MMQKVNIEKVISIIVGLLFGIVILDNIRQAAEGTVTKYLSIILLVILALYTVKKGRFIFGKNNRALALFGFFWFYAAVVNAYNYNDSAPLFRLGLIFFTAFMCSNIEYDYKMRNQIENIIVACSIVFAILGVVFNFNNADRVDYKIWNNLTVDPNIYCATMLLPYFICLNKFLDKKKVGSLILIFIFLISFMCTGSRGGVYSVVLSTALHFAMQYMRLNIPVKEKIKKLVAMLVIVIGIAYIVYMVSGLFSNASRLSLSTVLDDKASGRFHIWEQALNRFKEYSFSDKLLGKGLGSFQQISGTNKVAHNFIVQALLEGGIVGLFTYAVIMWLIAKTSFKNRGSNYFALFVATIAMGLSIELVVSRFFWNSIVFILFISDNCQGTDVPKLSEAK